MEHELVAELVLSSAPSDPSALEALVPKIAADAIQRTVGTKGRAELLRSELSGDRLSLELGSEGPRPHQVLLAFVRRFAEELGRQQKVGVRTFRAVRYRTAFTLEEPPTGPISLPLPHTLTFGGTHAVLELTDLPEEGLRDNWMDRAVTLVSDKVRRQRYAGKGEFWQLLTQSPARDHPFAEDPTDEMLKRHWIRNGPTKGKWFLGPTAAHLLRTMERIALKEVLEPVGFEEVLQPHHDSFDILLKTGHLEGLPGEFYYVTEPKTRDPGAWETFTDLVRITRKVPEAELAKLVSPPAAVSCYAQCPTIYWWLSGRTIASGSLPLRVFDRAAVSNRYESGGRHGLERVDEFHRIEPVFVGTPAQLMEIRQQLLDRYAHVFNDVLELEWRTAWVTPFYLQQSGGVGVEDSTEHVKGTIDFEAYLPYRGPRDKAEWLEFQNLSIVGDKYTRPFTIRAQKGGDLWSGCSGIGLERWLIAFLSEKGFNPADWPTKFRDFAGELPREVQFL